MTHQSDAAPHTLHYSNRASAKKQTLFQVGAGLGIAACCISVLVFLGAIFGFDASLYLAPLPLAMGALGLVLAVIGAVMHGDIEGPSVVAAMFINVAAMVGGALEMLMWMWKPVVM